MGKRFALSVAVYMLATFAVGFLWHLVAFERRYLELAVYRQDFTFALGIAAMLVQGVAYAWVYPRFFRTGADAWLRDAVRFGLLFGAVGWSYGTLAVAAKHPMSSVSGYLMIETAFTATHFALVSPLIALVWREG